MTLLTSSPRRSTTPTSTPVGIDRRGRIALEAGCRPVKPLAVAQVPRLIARHRERSEYRPRHVRRGPQRGVGQLLERRRAVDAERADAGATQRGQMASDPECGAEVASERADVGAARAVDDDVEIEEPAGPASGRF